MTTMIAEVYKALREAKVSEESATAAAEAVASRNGRLGRIEERLDHLDEHLTRADTRFATVETRLAAVETRLATVEARLGMLQWLVGSVGIGILLLLIRAFWPGG